MVLTACIDEQEFPSEFDQSSSTSSSPDLTITIDSVVANGTTVTVNFTVTNQGNADATSFWVDMWEHLDSPPVLAPSPFEGDDFFQYTSGLASGASASGTLVVTSIRTSGTAYATVDTNLEVDESNESNNITSLVYGPPDLSISTFSIPSTGPQNSALTPVSATVTNNGGATANNFNVRYYLSSDTVFDVGDTLIDGCFITSLAVSSSTSCDLNIAIPTGIANGDWYIIASADDTNSVVESDESNNLQFNAFRFWTHSTCPGFSIPDLSSSSCSITFSTAPAGAVAKAIDTNFSITHPFSSDLLIQLQYETSPGVFQSRTLWNNEGGSSANPTRTVTGIFEFSSRTVNGKWILLATDSVALDSGSFSSWWIRIFY